MGVWVLWVALGVALLSAVEAAPAETRGKDSSEEDSHEVVYDQRQNGTENLRVSVEDVMVVVAPAEGLVQAGGGALNSLALGAVGAAMLNRVTTPDCGAGGRCKAAPHSQRSRLRLSSLLQPLVNRVQQHR